MSKPGHPQQHRAPQAPRPAQVARVVDHLAAANGDPGRDRREHQRRAQPEVGGDVNRLVKLYASRNASTGSDRYSGSRLGRNSKRRRHEQQRRRPRRTRATLADARACRPGCAAWPCAGFSASSRASASRLKAIAALRAVTMDSRMPSRSCQRKASARRSPRDVAAPGHHGRQQRKRQREQRVAEANHLQRCGVDVIEHG